MQTSEAAVDTASDAVETATGFDFTRLTTPEFWQNEFLPAVGPFLLKLLIAILIYWIGMKIAKWAYKVVSNNAVKAPNVDQTLANFFGSIVKYLIVALTLIGAISALGVQTTALVAILGAVTLAIGLALQGTLGNVASGVMLMLFRPYKLGDYVAVAGEEGIVDDINIFTTNLKSLDNIKIIIANGAAWSSTIRNFTSMGVRRVDVDYRIDYSDNIDKAIKTVTDIAGSDPRVLAEPHGPWAKVVTLNESSVDIQSRVWCSADDYWDVMFDQKKAVKEAFDKAGITIPYPHTVELDG